MFKIILGYKNSYFIKDFMQKNFKLRNMLITRNVGLQKNLDFKNVVFSRNFELKKFSNSLMQEFFSPGLFWFK